MNLNVRHDMRVDEVIKAVKSLVCQIVLILSSNCLCDRFSAGSEIKLPA